MKNINLVSTVENYLNENDGIQEDKTEEIHEPTKTNLRVDKCYSSLIRLPLKMLNEILIHCNFESSMTLLEVTNKFLRNSVRNHFLQYDAYSSKVATWSWDNLLRLKCPQFSNYLSNDRFKIQCKLIQVEEIVIQDFNVSPYTGSLGTHLTPQFVKDKEQYDNERKKFINELLKASKRCSQVQILSFHNYYADISMLNDEDFILLVDSMIQVSKCLKKMVFQGLIDKTSVSSAELKMKLRIRMIEFLDCNESIETIQIITNKPDVSFILNRCDTFPPSLNPP